ncbi:MAG: EamA family transporter, partial [Candidatus Marinimicrobia bacterium]|nr:EamA family transporter [Candidatus Neomarinimicrobiota bacterium]
TLAVMNNLVIPLGLIIELIVFPKVINLETFLIGTLIIIGTIIMSLKIDSKVNI